MRTLWASCATRQADLPPRPTWTVGIWGSRGNPLSVGGRRWLVPAHMYLVARHDCWRRERWEDKFGQVNKNMTADCRPAEYLACPPKHTGTALISPDMCSWVGGQAVDDSSICKKTREVAEQSALERDRAQGDASAPVALRRRGQAAAIAALRSPESYRRHALHRGRAVARDLFQPCMVGRQSSGWVGRKRARQDGRKELVCMHTFRTCCLTSSGR